MVLRLPGGLGAPDADPDASPAAPTGSFSTLSGAAGRIFDPASGNRTAITFPATAARHLRLTGTANTAWPAVQVSTLEAYAS